MILTYFLKGMDRYIKSISRQTVKVRVHNSIDVSDKSPKTGSGVPETLKNADYLFFWIF